MKYLYCFIIIFIVFKSYGQDRKADSLFLIDLINVNQDHTLNWDINTPIDNWSGITLKNNRLSNLYVNNKNLYVIPSSISNSNELVNFQCYNNNITQLPNEITKLSLLRDLTIYGNNITKLPEEIDKLINLRYLNAQWNQINYIPLSFNKLPNIYRLVIHSNNLGYSALELIPRFINRATINPQNKLNNDITIYYENSVELIVNDSSVNNTYTWYKNNSPIGNSNVRKLTTNENGLFYCIITNSDPFLSDLPTVTSGNYEITNAGPFWSDSTALAILRDTNIGNNLGWPTTNPTRVKDWAGVTHSGDLADRVTSVVIDNKEMYTLPAEMATMDGLTALEIQNNKLVFADLANLGSLAPTTFTYAPQAELGEERSIGFSLGNTVTMTVDSAAHANDTYQWFNENGAIAGAISNTYSAAAVGSYYCEVKNSLFPDLTLKQATTFIYDQDAYNNDERILKELYTSNSGNSLGWDLSKQMDTWNGVTLRGGRVYELALNGKILSTLPADFGQLTELSTLNLSNNSFSSLPILSTLSKLTSFQLGNNLFASIPATVTDLTQLEVLALNNNQITLVESSISNLTNLTDLSIQENFLTFEDIELLPQTSNSRTYSPQGTAGAPQYVGTSGYIYIVVDQTIDPTLRDVNTYQWYYEGVAIPNSNNDSLFINNQFGEFYTKINNPTITDLTLKTASIFVSPDKVDEQDSLVLVALKNIDLNPNNTLNWPNTSPVGSWEGIQVDGENARITTLDIWNKNIDALPSSFTSLTALENANISANNLIALPNDMDALTNLSYINISNNHLSFAEMDKIVLNESNGRVNFVYGNQKSIGEEGTTVTLENGFNFLAIPEEDRTTNDFYQWYRNGSIIDGENEESLRVNNTGEYNYTISNERYTTILLTSYSITVDGNVTSIGNEIGGTLKLYPNPTANRFTLEISNAVRIIDVKVYDVVGNIYLNIYNTSSLHKWSINLEGKPIGIYLVWVKTDKGEVTMKVFKK
ncbi:T9SS type A sorting domain-containing protein [Flammeovirga kamogawensis]|uniref:T9SS type A sorting domain-containing protein n=1 Tax=Flammeovirga kamogawensis TaxID=373891 RepID=A0ABX8GYU0_9BACT|nr:T9SS type A sorting domain-containing protein [Flammeovirga kamogawensis]MBB6460752.1 Leucine-rich repeat (LRR) protein [Flammeovirga kamogawensis]QWG08105.1 T9SS type A sorting domain-containing protein [Flammeovirga kamogawensis]TRX69908.1 T9SS type A sorting domain-containing protein [Flammeovirga kamogawensis]